MGVSLFVIFLLRYLQIKRMKMRDKWKEENGKNNILDYLFVRVSAGIVFLPA